MTPNKLARFVSQVFRSASDLLEMPPDAPPPAPAPSSSDELRHRGDRVMCPDLPLGSPGPLMDAWSQVVGAMPGVARRTDLPDAPRNEPPVKRTPLPMSTGVKVKRGQSAQITSRPQSLAYRVDFMMIENASHWLVNDIKVGNRSQLAQAGDVPGACFAAGSKGTDVLFDTLQVAMDFVLVVTYVGPKKDGEIFQCSIMGNEVL